MATCDMGYEHEAGAAPVTSPEPEVILTEPPTNEHDVAIAEAEAAARVASDKAYAASRDPELEAENARLRGELDGMRTTLAALQPEPAEVESAAPVAEPEVIVTEADAEPAPPEDTPVPPEPKPKKSKGWWDNYR